MGITGLAVLLTAFVFAGQHRLDLFHALVVFHLVALVGLSTNASRAQRKKDKLDLARVLFTLLYYAATLGFFIFNIYIFATAPNFGPQAEECNARVKYVVFGVDSAATAPVFRGLFLAGFALLFMQRIIKELDKDGSWLDRNDASFQTLDLQRRAMADKLHEVMLPSLEGMKVISDAAGRGYIIAMTELMIYRNTSSASSSGNDWGFGQILAMVMLIGPSIELASSMFKRTTWGGGFGRRSFFRRWLIALPTYLLINPPPPPPRRPLLDGIYRPHWSDC